MKIVLRLGIFLSILLAGIFSVHADNEYRIPSLDNPFAAPEFQLKSENGKTHSLKDYRGKLVILNFWASWCPPCRAEMPSMERAWKKIKDQNMVILAVNVGEDADTIFEFTGQYPVTFPLLMDSDSSVIAEYPVRGLPTTFIISPDGIVRHRVIGGREWDAQRLINELKAIYLNYKKQ